MTVLEKIKRCVSLVWDFQKFYGEEDIEDFCSNELHTYSQNDEIMEYFKHIEELERKLEQTEKDLADYQFNYPTIKELQKENSELKERLKEHESIGNAQFWENVWSWKSKAEQLTKAKDLLKQWLQTSKASGCDNINIVTDTEQFLNSEVEK